MNAQ
jgi:hypothetical protein